MRCTYEKTIFENAESGFLILALKTQDTQVPQAARNTHPAKDNLIRFTATGYYLPTTNTIELELDGRWEQSKYGMQLAVESFTEIIPQTREGIIGYLSSGLIKGIGEKTAIAIVQKFGLTSLEVLENEPEKLLEVRGITENKLVNITASYTQSKSLRDIVALLSPFGISVKKAAKIQKEFGDQTMDILQNRPFELCSISGFGFKTVDSIARKTSCKLSDPLRVQGALRYVLDESQISGHLFLPKEQLCEKAYILLNEDFPSEVADKRSVVFGLYSLVQSGVMLSDNGNIYLHRNLYAETNTALRVAELLININDSTEVTKELSEFQDNSKIILSAKQAEAVKTAFLHNLSIITGGPGTGKTTVLKAVLEVFQKVMPDGKVLLSAPTGRASRRMAESTEYTDAKTLHSALSLVSDEEDSDYLNGNEPIEADLIIVDEVSMVDMYLANELFGRIQKGSRVVLVGDADQLPSVGAGNVFREFITCGLIPVTVLDMVFRQAKGSRIAMNAYSIKQDKTSLLYGSDFMFDTCNTAEEAAYLVQKHYMEEIAENGVEGVQILSPFKSRGEACVKSLNEAIHELVNPTTSMRPELKVGTRIYRLGDRVLQTKNKGDISNGDVGFIKSVFIGEDNDSTATIEFSGERVVTYAIEDLDMIEPAYAMTIHKSQGSEYPVVILPMLKSFYIMLKRNLVYTAITRAKSKVILIGQKSALFMAIHKNDIDERNTLLGDRIVEHYTALCDKQKAQAPDTVQMKMKIC